PAAELPAGAPALAAGAPPLAQPARPADGRTAAAVADRDRLDRDDRRRDRDRARDQGLGGQPVPDPVVVDGADAALRAAGPGLRGPPLRPRARQPLHLPLPRS